MITRQTSFSQIEDSPKEASNKMNTQKYTILEALRIVGFANRYQKMAYMYFCFQWILGGCLLMSPIFVFQKPSFECNSNQHFTAEQCEQWVCKQENPLQYQVKQIYSFVVEFDPPLICQRQWIADTVVALNYGGSIIGFLISIYISDNKGRKIASIIFWLLGGIGCIWSGIFSYHIWLAAVGLSIANGGVNPTITIHYCFINEHSDIPAEFYQIPFFIKIKKDGRFREYTSASLNIFYAIGTFYLVLANVLSPSWKDLIVYWVGIPMLLSIFYYFFIYEPPLFLYEKNKDKAVESLNKIARFNKKPEFSVDNLIVEDQMEQNEQKIYGVWDLLKYKSARVSTICTSIAFFVTQISYYGMNFTLSQIGLEVKYNTLAVAFAEFVAFSLVVCIIPTMRRRKWCFILTGLYSAIFLIFFFVKKPTSCTTYCNETIIQIVLIAVSRCVLSFQFSLCYVYFSELYPTTIRSLGLGFMSTIGQIGSVISAYFVTFFNESNINPIGMMGILGLASIFVYIPLKETYNKPLKNQIDELVQQFSSSYSNHTIELSGTQTQVSLNSPSNSEKQKS